MRPGPRKESARRARGCTQLTLGDSRLSRELSGLRMSTEETVLALEAPGESTEGRLPSSSGWAARLPFIRIIRAPLYTCCSAEVEEAGGGGGVGRQQQQQQKQRGGAKAKAQIHTGRKGLDQNKQHSTVPPLPPPSSYPPLPWA